VEAVIIVEVLGRRGQVEQRVRVDRFPFVLGRAYRCDLILDDPYVSPEHARLELDAAGRPLLRDLGSRNGSHDAANGTRVAELGLERGGEVRLGRTSLRLRRLDHEVEPPLLDAQQNALLRWAGSSSSAVPVWLAAVAAATAWSVWRSTYVELESSALLSQVLATVLAAAGWAGAWALAGRLLVHRGRFVSHLAAACSLWLLWSAFGRALELGHFLSLPIAFAQHAQLGVQSALFGILIWIHLQLATGLGRRTRALAGAGLSLLLLTTTELQNRPDPEFWVRTLPYWSQLEPVDPDWLPSEDPETFFARVHSLEAELSELAAERASNP